MCDVTEYETVEETGAGQSNQKKTKTRKKSDEERRRNKNA